MMSMHSSGGSHRTPLINFVLVAVLIAAVGCRAPGGSPSDIEQYCVRTASGSCELYSVSLVRLLAAPADFHGRNVQTRGYIVLRFEGTAIYLSREDADHSRYRNALWLSLDSLSDPRHGLTSSGPGTVEGTFDAGDLGHMGLFSAGIRVQRMLDGDEPRDSAGGSQDLAAPAGR